MSTRAALIAGAAGSLALMLYAGRHSPPALVVIFACWVVSPFSALLWASARWPLRAVSLAIALGSLVLYGAFVAGVLPVKLGAIFLDVPAASWLVAAIGLALARAATSRESARRD